MKDYLNYKEVKQTLILKAYENLICEERYSYTFISQIWHKEILDALPSNEAMECRDLFNERLGNDYKHIEKIVEKLKSETKIKYRTKIQTNKSKNFFNESIFDEKVIEKNEYLLRFMSKRILGRDYIGKRAINIPPKEEYLEKFEDIEIANNFENISKSAFYHFTKGIHHYIPKSGKVSLLEAYIIAVLANCYNGRAVGTMDKKISRKKQLQKKQLIEKEIYSLENKEILTLICLQEIIDVLSAEREQIVTPLKIEIEKEEEKIKKGKKIKEDEISTNLDEYWSDIFPIVLLFSNGILVENDLKLDKQILGKRIKEDYYEVLVYQLSAKPSAKDSKDGLDKFLFYPEYILDDIKMQIAFDIYIDIRAYIKQLQESAFDVIMKLPSLDWE